MTNESKPADGWHAGQWGLSALLIGGLILFMFPIMTMGMFAAMAGAANNAYLKTSHIDLGIVATYVSVFGLAALAFFALLCGSFGILRGLGGRQPMGLALSGTVVAIVAVVVSIVLCVIAWECIDWAQTYKKERFESNRPRFERNDFNRIP